MVTMGTCRKSPSGYTGDPSSTPYDHPFAPNWGAQLPVKTYITNCGQTVPDTMTVLYVLTAYGNIPCR